MCLPKWYNQKSRCIYIKQPKGFNNGTGHIYYLIKSQYGLKQAGREWNDELNKQLESQTNRRIEVVTILVDDLLLTQAELDLRDQSRLSTIKCTEKPQS